jgi:hypothetical protein
VIGIDSTSLDFARSLPLTDSFLVGIPQSAWARHHLNASVAPADEIHSPSPNRTTE